MHGGAAEKTVNDPDFQYTVALTSCGRFDLLRRTVESFLRFADIPPVKFIVVEDSGDDKVRDVLAEIDFPFQIIINSPPRQGQAKSIDAAYSRITTPFIFHCEDDWEFFRPGFIGESVLVLNEFPKAVAVMLRGRDERKELKKLPAEELNGVRFFRATPETHWYFFGYAYNPGLRRLSDYRRVAPFSAIGGEREVSFVFKKLGYYTAHLEIPAACHLGWGRRAQERPSLRKKWMPKKIKILKWRFFGLPKKWKGQP